MDSSTKFILRIVTEQHLEKWNKLSFFKGSFGKCEFVRTTTNVSSSTPLEIVPHNKQIYEKPYRLRTVEIGDNKFVIDYFIS